MKCIAYCHPEVVFYCWTTGHVIPIIYDWNNVFKYERRIMPNVIIYEY